MRFSSVVKIKDVSVTSCLKIVPQNSYIKLSRPIFDNSKKPAGSMSLTAIGIVFLK